MIVTEVDASSYADFADHEKVLSCRDEKSGLHALIAIHNRTLGPALGGCRMWPYAGEQDAIKDVLRLSRGMTYKSAISDLPLGGGKAVIIGNPKLDKTNELMAAMGRFVHTLQGQYITAEDSGTNVEDLKVMAKETSYVAGINDKTLSDGSRVNGDPSPSTAYGVFVGIKASVAYKLSKDSLEGVKVAVQGVGNVGARLVRLLVDAGAQVFISDIFDVPVKNLCAELPVTALPNDMIHKAAVDVYAPCALGGIISVDSLEEIQASIIAGAANNQLQNYETGLALHNSGKIYAPDYVINAGGIIDIYHERIGYDHKQVTAHIDNIGVVLTKIYDQSRIKNLPFDVTAGILAEARLKLAAITKTA